MSAAMTRGVVFVHSAPPALCPHVEWAVAGVLDARVHLDWTNQPAEPGTVRGELSWQGLAGTGVDQERPEVRVRRVEVATGPAALALQSIRRARGALNERR